MESQTISKCQSKVACWPRLFDHSCSMSNHWLSNNSIDVLWSCINNNFVQGFSQSLFFAEKFLKNDHDYDIAMGLYQLFYKWNLEYTCRG